MQHNAPDLPDDDEPDGNEGAGDGSALPQNSQQNQAVSETQDDTDSKPASRRRRARRRSATIDTSVPSPCVAVCEYDGKGYCKGCFRDADEIREWMIMTREQKLAVLELLDQRRESQL